MLPREALAVRTCTACQGLLPLAEAGDTPASSLRPHCGHTVDVSAQNKPDERGLWRSPGAIFVSVQSSRGMCSGQNAVTPNWLIECSSSSVYFAPAAPVINWSTTGSPPGLL